MLVHLNLAREFRGRVYATGNPQACFELGGGVSEMTLRIPLGTQCGTVQQVFIVYGQKNHELIIIWFNIIMYMSNKKLNIFSILRIGEGM